MRIAIDARPLTTSVGGVASYCRHLIKALARCDHQNHYLLMAKADFESPVVDHRFTKQVDRFPLWLQTAVPWRLAKKAIDLFHGTNSMAPLVTSARRVVTIHDLTLLTRPQDHTLRNRLLTGVQMRLAVRGVDAIIAVSECTKRDIVRLLGVDDGKVRVIYRAADEKFRPVCDEAALAATRKKYSAGCPFILYVGALEPRKNVAGLVRAYAELCREPGPNRCLVIAGPAGWRNSDVFRLVREQGLASKVIFAGEVPEGELPALYSAAQLFVYPSFYEGFGLPPLEAMACGTPVVTSNVSSLPEVVGDAAITVDPHDIATLAKAMRYLLADEQARARWAARGLEQAKRFPWLDTGRQTLRVYEEVAGGR